MLSFSSNGVESAIVNESNITGESGGSILKAIEEIDLWHLRLGHPNVVILKNTLLSCNQLRRNKNVIPSFCSACQYGKQSKQQFKNTETKPHMQAEQGTVWIKTSSQSLV